MRKLRLRKEVKGGLLIAIALFILIGALNLEYKKAINDCMNNGNSQTYCEKGID